ncbi:MAG: hypothetical protein ACREHG_01235 [Candidatus Saccharimonadales bacterium]
MTRERWLEIKSLIKKFFDEHGRGPTNLALSSLHDNGEIYQNPEYPHPQDDECQMLVNNLISESGVPATELRMWALRIKYKPLPEG